MNETSGVSAEAMGSTWKARMINEPDTLFVLIALKADWNAIEMREGKPVLSGLHGLSVNWGDPKNKIARSKPMVVALLHLVIKKMQGV